MTLFDGEWLSLRVAVGRGEDRVASCMCICMLCCCGCSSACPLAYSVTLGKMPPLAYPSQTPTPSSVMVMNKP